MGPDHPCSLSASTRISTIHITATLNLGSIIELVRFLHVFGQFNQWDFIYVELTVPVRTTTSSSSKPLSLIRLFCDPFIISHLTIRQNGTVAVKHLQGSSTGHASTFCLAISLSVKGTRQIGWESIWQPRSSYCLRGRERGGGAEGQRRRKKEVQSLSATIRIVPQGFATRAVKFTV